MCGTCVVNTYYCRVIIYLVCLVVYKKRNKKNTSLNTTLVQNITKICHVDHVDVKINALADMDFVCLLIRSV